MKVAFLIQCHKNSQQLNKLIEVLLHPDVEIFLHIDKKSTIDNDIIPNKSLRILPKNLRVDVQWGTFSQVEATLNLLNFARSYGEYDYFCLISGQDLPIVSMENILAFFSKDPQKNYINLFVSKNNSASNKNTNFDKRNEIVYSPWLLKRKAINRIIRRLWVAISGGYNHTFKLFKRRPLKNTNFYFGSSWWCVTNDFVKYIGSYLESHPEYTEFYKKASCPDESFFQTLLMNSEFVDTREDYLHYVDWQKGKNSPQTLTDEDYENIINSNKLFARKFDDSVDSAVIDRILQEIKNKP